MNAKLQDRYYPIPGDIISFREPAFNKDYAYMTSPKRRGKRFKAGVRYIKAKIIKESWSPSTGTRTLSLQRISASGFLAKEILFTFTRYHSSLFRKGSHLTHEGWSGDVSRDEMLKHFLFYKEKGDQEFFKRTGTRRRQRRSTTTVYKNSKPKKKHQKNTPTYQQPTAIKPNPIPPVAIKPPQELNTEQDIEFASLDEIKANTFHFPDSGSIPEGYVRLRGTLRYAPPSFLHKIPPHLLPENIRA